MDNLNAEKVFVEKGELLAALYDADAITMKGVKIINQFPAADVAKVPHGRWVNWGKSGTQTYENYGTCSVCHEDAEIHTEHRNYCPNCGAKMDLE